MSWGAVWAANPARGQTILPENDRQAAAGYKVEADLLPLRRISERYFPVFVLKAAWTAEIWAFR
tara:strand:+ start:54 stop:245 length:192 start_codon:yes stop_codon:yes gene_type:complete